MTVLVDSLLLFGVAYVGYVVFRLLHIPTPALLGPLLFAGGLNYFYLYPDLSLEIVSFASKVIIGITLGRRFDRASIAVLRTLPIPALLTALWMLGASLLTGFVLYAFAELPLDTALIGSAAGGIAEMIIFAMALGTNVVVVAFIQLFRLVFTMFSIPLIARAWVWYDARAQARRAAALGTAVQGASTHRPDRQTDPQRMALTRNQPLESFTPVWYALLVVLAVGTAWFGEWLAIPAGAMLGAMLGTGVVVMGSGRACAFPRQFNEAAQLCLGTIIARSLTHDTVLMIGGLLGPLLVPTFMLLVLGLILSYILYRVAGWDPMTCILSTCPAGLLQIIPIAEEYGADVLKVGVMHTVRLFSIISMLPWIIRWIVG